MKHGENKDIHFSLEPGDYTITFESTDSSDVNGETVLTVDCDIEASYHISCHMDNVSVETLYIDRQVELVEGEIKLKEVLIKSGAQIAPQIFRQIVQ